MFSDLGEVDQFGGHLWGRMKEPENRCVSTGAFLMFLGFVLAHCFWTHGIARPRCAQSWQFTESLIWEMMGTSHMQLDATWKLVPGHSNIRYYTLKPFQLPRLPDCSNLLTSTSDVSDVPHNTNPGSPRQSKKMHSREIFWDICREVDHSDYSGPYLP